VPAPSLGATRLYTKADLAVSCQPSTQQSLLSLQLYSTINGLHHTLLRHSNLTQTSFFWCRSWALSYVSNVLNMHSFVSSLAWTQIVEDFASSPKITAPKALNILTYVCSVAWAQNHGIRIFFSPKHPSWPDMSGSSAQLNSYMNAIKTADESPDVSSVAWAQNHGICLFFSQNTFNDQACSVFLPGFQPQYKIHQKSLSSVTMF
jgi:hypothetical protein